MKDFGLLHENTNITDSRGLRIGRNEWVMFKRVIKDVLLVLNEKRGEKCVRTVKSWGYGFLMW